MRHMYIRGIIAVIWLAAAIVSVYLGNLEMAAFYIILGIIFLLSAYSIWKKEKDDKGGN